MQLMTVGNAAEQTGLSAKAIRLYERKGLLAEAERTQAGYRLFTTDDVAILHFIRRAKALDLGLDEIKDILDLQRGGEQPCQLVTSMLDTHLADIDQKLADLRTLRDSLRTARRRSHCPPRWQYRHHLPHHRKATRSTPTRTTRHRHTPQ